MDSEFVWNACVIAMGERVYVACFASCRQMTASAIRRQPFNNNNKNLYKHNYSRARFGNMQTTFLYANATQLHKHLPMRSTVRRRRRRRIITLLERADRAGELASSSTWGACGKRAVCSNGDWWWCCGSCLSTCYASRFAQRMRCGPS